MPTRSVPRKHVILVDISIRILTMVSKRKDADEDLYMCILAVTNFMNFDYNWEMDNQRSSLARR